MIGWYNANLKEKYENYISKESIYCNDRSGTSYYTDYTGYSGRIRLSNKKQPSYQCGMNTTGGKVNIYGTWIQNGTVGILYNDASDQDKFKEGVGLMTADEISFAGGVYGSNAPNTYYYRNSVNNCTSNTDRNCSVVDVNYWWTMTPYGFNDTAYGYAVGINSNPGRLDLFEVSSEMIIRPVISISKNVLTFGSGTSTDPYVIE